MAGRFSRRFDSVQGGLFVPVTKADVGDGMARFLAAGGANMAWADPFSPNPSLPASVMDAMRAYLETGMASHYVQPIGPDWLRATIAAEFAEKSGHPLDPGRNVLVTPGSDSGLLFAMFPFLDDGDEVLIPDPSYPSNFLNAKLLGGKAVPVPTYAQDNYQLRREELESRVTGKTKIVLITHPNNPTTTVFRRETLEMLAEFVVKHDLILVCDQAFEDHVYDGIEFVSPCTLPGMWERTVTVRSISKGLGLSGLRIGFLIAEDHIMDKLYGAAVNVLGAPNTLSCVGADAALRDETILPAYYERLERRRNLAFSILGDTPGVGMKPAESGILSWLDVSRLGTGAEVAAYIQEHAHVMVNDGAPYGAQGVGGIRIVSACFADDAEAARRLRDIRAALETLAREKGITE